jgi:hypothetical protein
LDALPKTQSTFFGLKMETRAKNAHITLILTLDLAQGMDVLLKQCLVES